MSKCLFCRRSLTADAKTAIVCAILLDILIFIGIILAVLFFLRKVEETIWFPQYESESKLGKYRSAAVATDAAPCAVVGKDILEKNGTAVDAAIAVLVCIGAVNPQSSGLGGGFLMLYYNREKQSAHYIDARETAPSKATEDMFAKDAASSTTGGLAMGVPGEIKGLEEAHDKFGSLPWADLFQPTIKLCRKGIKVGFHLDKSLKGKARVFNQFEYIRRIFTNNETGKLYKLGEVFRRPDLADTLEDIAKKKSAAIYGNAKGSGPLAKAFLKDLKAAGSVIGKNDLLNYSPVHRLPIKKTLRNNLTLHTISTPGSGALLTFMLGVLTGYDDLNPEVVKSREKTLKTLHRMIETFKFAFAKRMYFEDSSSERMKKLELELISDAYADEIRSKIVDLRTFDDVEHYGVNVTVKEDHGTSHLSIIAPNGDAVSVTSTINIYFGSMVLSPSTGIIMNDQMDDFTFPNKPDAPFTGMNSIKPGRKPFSSISPAIITDSNGDVVLTIGASGGTHIIPVVAQTIIRALWFGQDIKQAIDSPRLHHQLVPNHTEYDERFPHNLLGKLKMMGHKLAPRGDSLLGIAQGVARGKDGYLYANADYRKGGDVDGF